MKIKRPLSIDGPSYRYGILVAAELASEYDRSSIHPYQLGDCILAKFNLLKKERVRKNKVGPGSRVVLERLDIKVSNPDGMTHKSSKKREIK